MTIITDVTYLNEQVANLNASLAERDQRIDNLHQQLDSTQASLATYKDDAARATSLIENLRTTVSNFDQNAKDLRYRIRTFFAERIEAEHGSDYNDEDEISVSIDDINTLLANFGIEEFHAMRQYQVSGTVTFTFCAVVEAANEDMARDHVENLDIDGDPTFVGGDELVDSLSYIEFDRLRIDSVDLN